MGGMINLNEGTAEVAASSWSEVPVDKLAWHLIKGKDRPRIIAIDGRSGAGKSTFSTILARTLRGLLGGPVGLVSTDDLAWNAPMFGWHEEAIEEVFTPICAGKEVNYVPEAWRKHERDGSIRVAADVEAVVVEGVASSQRALTDFLDATIWVQSDVHLAKERGLARDIATKAHSSPAESERIWNSWIADENVFFEEDKPWTRADIMILGNVQSPALVGVARVAKP